MSKLYAKVAHSNFTFWDSSNTFISGRSFVSSAIYDEGYSRIDIPDSPDNPNLSHALDINVIYDIEVDILDKNTNITTNIKGKMYNIENNLW